MNSFLGVGVTTNTLEPSELNYVEKWFLRGEGQNHYANADRVEVCDELIF